MLQYIKRFFKNNTSNTFKEDNKNIEIKKGDIFTFNNDDGNPFRSNNCRILIKDVKDGWVLYAINPQFQIDLFNNESMKIEKFLKIFTKVEK